MLDFLKPKKGHDAVVGIHDMKSSFYQKADNTKNLY